MAGLLSEDLIEEIILRLPAKYAIRCTSLNKNFFSFISRPSFARQNAILSSSRQSPVILHCSTSSPAILTKLDEELCRSISAELSACVFILASCNGLLLLGTLPKVNPIKFYHYVFNPITGGIIQVGNNWPLSLESGYVGLAAPVGSHHFKLVELGATENPTALRRFRVVVPRGNSTVVKSLVDFVCDGFTPMVDFNIRPVYAHGSLHWLGEPATEIVAFDVDREEPRIINGPLKNPPSDFLLGAWFGQAQGSLSFIYAQEHEIVIHKHDYDKDEWGIQYRINADHNYICDHSIYRNCKPVFYDGKRFFVERWIGGDRKIYMLDSLSTTPDSYNWEVRSTVPEWSDSDQVFTAFVPTLAKVSDDEHNISKVEMDHYIQLRTLQCLVR